MLPKKGLILLAGLVWLAAGCNIFRLGAPQVALAGGSPLLLLGALAVFLVFFFGMFRRLVGRHTARILAYEAQRLLFLRFFDAKSYLLMAFMMSFGILLRRSGLLPAWILGPLYVGIGSALMAAGAAFLVRFGRALARASD